MGGMLDNFETIKIPYEQNGAKISPREGICRNKQRVLYKITFTAVQNVIILDLILHSSLCYRPWRGERLYVFCFLLSFYWTVFKTVNRKTVNDK